jgi:SAM-dependent methyltransferase
MDPSLYPRMAELEDGHWWFVSRRKIVESLLERLKLDADAKILEAGCGTGGNLPMLACLGRVYATELDQQGLHFSRARGLGEVEPGRLPDQIPFGDTRFDLILMTDVLEHLEQDAAALHALRGRLKPGGALLLTVPALQWLWSAHDVAHHHHRRYHARQLRALACEAGYEVQYLTYYNFLLLPAIVATRSIRRLTGVRSAQGHDLRMPSPRVNCVLAAVFSSERHILRWTSIPIGMSLVMLARNPARASGAAEATK